MATKKTTSSASRDTLRPPTGGLAIRMYRHGLGDCFLLAFAKSRSKEPCYVLIDCGVHTRQSKGRDRLGQVMKNIVEVTSRKLDVVVATHEHADHLSGFVQKGSPFVGNGLQLDHFWAAWTERVGDPQADRLREKRGKARAAIRQALEKLEEQNETALAGRVMGLTDFEDLRREDLHAAFGKKIAAGSRRKTKVSSNEIAQELLQEHARTVEYCEPGKVLALPGVDNVRAYVLGPPRDEVLLKRDQAAPGPRRETYLMSLTQQQTFALAPAFGEGPLVQDIDPDLRHPFERTLQRVTRFAARPVAGGPPHRPVGEDPLPFFQENYFKPEHEWRRIDADWLGVTEQLALNLDNDTNNTSLVLAFEWGEVGQGPVFLFVGDAQVGNWLSWCAQTYKVGGRTVSAEDLLSRTVVYKVGHHGSHNATLRRNPLRTSARYPQGEPFGLELMPSRLIALLPVDQEAVRKPMPKPWHMPHTPLYERLLQKAAGRVLRSDGQDPGSEGITDLKSYSPATTPVRPPGLTHVSWREASRKFDAGLKCPLYYDLFFEP